MDELTDRFPALQSRRSRPIDGAVDEARRLLWRAYQHGTLNEEEFASTLERLDFNWGFQDTSSQEHQPARQSSSDVTQR
jgi:hypothetical protein